VTRDGTASGLRAVCKRLVRTVRAACLRPSKSHPHPPGDSLSSLARYSRETLPGGWASSPPKRATQGPGWRYVPVGDRRRDEQGSRLTDRPPAGRSFTHGASCWDTGAPRGSHRPGPHPLSRRDGRDLEGPAPYGDTVGNRSGRASRGCPEAPARADVLRWRVKHSRRLAVVSGH